MLTRVELNISTREFFFEHEKMPRKLTSLITSQMLILLNNAPINCFLQQFGFINGISVRWPIYIINSVHKTKFLFFSVLICTSSDKIK